MLHAFPTRCGEHNPSYLSECGALRAGTALSQSFTVHRGGLGNCHRGAAWGSGWGLRPPPPRSAVDSVGIRSGTWFLGLRLACYSVQFDSDDGFGEK